MAKKKVTFAEILEEIDIETQGYSGRGCYGQECLAVSGDYSSSSEFWGSVLADVLRAYEGNDLVSRLEIVSSAMKDMSEDSLGRGSIFYWLRMPVKK